MKWQSLSLKWSRKKYNHITYNSDMVCACVWIISVSFKPQHINTGRFLITCQQSFLVRAFCRPPHTKCTLCLHIVHHLSVLRSFALYSSPVPPHSTSTFPFLSFPILFSHPAGILLHFALCPCNVILISALFPSYIGFPVPSSLLFFSISLILGHLHSTIVVY